MIIKSVNLETVCGITSKLPDNTLPEVAFAGKSNVGKIIIDQCTDESCTREFQLTQTNRKCRPSRREFVKAQSGKTQT